MNDKKSRGFLTKEDIQEAGCHNAIEAVSFLSALEVSKRALGAYYFYQNYQEKYADSLIDFYKNEKKLYVRLYLEKALQKGNKETLYKLINAIEITDNDYKMHLTPSKKKTFPLPINHFSRIIAHMNKNLFDELLNAFDGVSLSVKYSIIEALGFMCYHHADLQTDKNQQFFKSLLALNDVILSIKAITGLSSFRTIDNLLFLDDLLASANSIYHLEIKRSMSLIAPYALLNDKAHKVVVATKYFIPDEMKKLFKMGARHFGENRVSAFLDKYDNFKKYPITWHFIGHLQRNKAALIINKIDYLHSLDSVELAKMLNELLTEPLNCFIQVNLTNEPQKYGIDLKNLDSFIETIKKYDKIKVVGLMAMGVHDDLAKTTLAFRELANQKEKYSLPYLSMGMTDDYLLAIRYKATHLRIGSLFKGVV